MKKNIRMMMLLAMMSVLLFVGCGNQKETEEPQTETETQTENVTHTELPVDTEMQAETEIPHEHSYVESITTRETCEADGVKTFTCACGETYTEAIKASGHAYVADESTREGATCSKDGKEADKVCSVCGNKVEGAKISKTSHKYGDYVYNNDATQKADGTKSRTCSSCGKVDTKTASGTKLSVDPSSLRAVKSLDDIPSVGKMTSADSSSYDQVKKNIKAGKYEKIRYVASNGDQFCMWNVRLTDERDKDTYGVTTYYWFMAPIGDEFSSGYKYSNFTGQNASDTDRCMIAQGRNISGSVNESMINGPSLPPAYREVNSAECPVNLYEIVETDNMVSVWVESTNCGQEGIGTCGSFDCKQTCLRYKTLEKLRNMPQEKNWGFNYMGGENGRINWNGKLLVNFYYMKS